MSGPQNASLARSLLLGALTCLAAGAGCGGRELAPRIPQRPATTTATAGQGSASEGVVNAAAPNLTACGEESMPKAAHRFLAGADEVHPPPEDVATAPDDALVVAEGLASKVLVAPTEPDGERPREGARIALRYTMWTRDGEMVESTLTRGGAVEARLSSLHPELAKGLMLMVPGEIRRLWTNGANNLSTPWGRAGGPATFDVQLLEVHNPPTAPGDVAAPPANAMRTPTGLSYLILQTGSGKEHPDLDTPVWVHYSGWTTDGKLFDSSVLRGKPARFQPNQVIQGWTESLLTMVSGEKRRVWIPAELAYGDTPRPGAPAGMLVFEIELLNLDPETMTEPGSP